jgi:hypothetical protein
MARSYRPHRGFGGPHHMGTRPLVGPRRGVHTVGDGCAHQLVVGRVVLDLVDAVPVQVVRAQDGLVAVGELTPTLGFTAGGNRPDLVDLFQPPLPTLTDQGLDKDRRRREVVVFQPGDLVGDDMGIAHAPMLQKLCGCTITAHTGHFTSMGL